MSSSSSSSPTADGPGSASQAPNLPQGFTDSFSSRYVYAGELRLHAVVGGAGPPLLLVHGWPQTWYQFRLVMPALARYFQVIAVDQRGIGLSASDPSRSAQVHAVAHPLQPARRGERTARQRT